MVQELVRVLAPLEGCAVQVVVTLLASSIATGVVLSLQHLPRLLSVSESLPSCTADAALHHHGGSPACSQEEHGVDVGAAELLLYQLVVPVEAWRPFRYHRYLLASSVFLSFSLPFTSTIE